ncbi:helicase C-terminal domain-containing protein [Aspergillus alliaceus]|uniref:helicase C-terminal domain-containing protein n=1 Tax=Petromyces alliaceus TaxID=209559 RepID=UPI0012A541F1|nr:uncharacterized protein BDW43DRAFT_304969 [Aspergillus alliaceus]KAB8226971.1 hypothetical protein BDW43DRAFT_304969 [Aspergillus alliaceus]
MTRFKIIQFRGIQAPALQAIQDNKSPMVAVISIRKDKSMLFILPVFAEPGGVIIIVILLISLYQDMIWQCQTLGISCQLNYAYIQIVLLTAILPPWLETPLFCRIGYARDRPNIVIIYSYVVSHVTGIAWIDKLSILYQFIQEKTTVIAATSILEIEIDIPNIYSIIYIEMPRTLLDYAQENRQAGRNGYRSKAIII